MPVFSIIIPAYNIESYIAEALKSCCAQKFDDWEAIIVNDGSTDNTGKIAAEYCKTESRFHLLTQENQGLSHARNHGIAQARGEYIVFLDGDDLLHEDILANYAQAITQYTPDIICSSGYRLFYEDQKQKNVLADFTCNQVISGQQAFIDIVNQHSNCPVAPVFIRCYRRELFCAAKLNFTPKRIHEDEEWTPRIFYYAEKAVFINAPAIYYRIRPNSLSRTVHDGHIASEISNCLDMINFFANKNLDSQYGAACLTNIIFNYAGFLFRANYSLNNKFHALKQRKATYIARKIRNLSFFPCGSIFIKTIFFTVRLMELMPFCLIPLHLMIKTLRSMRCNQNA